MFKMKNFRILFPFAIILCLVFMASCKKDDDGGGEQTQEQIETARLVKTWEYENVTLEGAQPGEDYTGFTLTITANEDATNKSYSTTNGQSAWPASGTWDFVDGTDFNTIRRSDGIEMTITELTATNLTLSFTITEDDVAKFGQRTQEAQGVVGEYVFELVAQ